VLTANQEKRVSVWDAATGKHLRDVSMPNQEDNGSGLPPDPRLPADRVFTSTHLKAVVVIGAGRVFALNAKEEFIKLDLYDAGHICHVTSNGRWISSAETQSSVEFEFGVSDVTKKHKFDSPDGHFGGSVGQTRYAGWVATSDDGRFVAAGYTDGQKDNGVQLHRYDGKGEVALTDAGGKEFGGHPRLGFSGDAKTLYATLADKLATWDTASGKRGMDVKLPINGGAVSFDPPRDRAFVLGDGFVYEVKLK
jgi:hypothetical protein